MAPEFTRDELRSGIRQIATEVVTTVVRENNPTLVKMINEDLAAKNNRIDSQGKRLTQHISDPQVHKHARAKA